MSRKTKIGTQVAHVARDSDTAFKVKRSKVNLQGAGAYRGGLSHSLLIFKHRRQNTSVSNTALLTAVTCPEVTLCCENPFDVLAIGDGVGCCKQSGAYRLVLY